jgi:hypothetical protein
VFRLRKTNHRPHKKRQEKHGMKKVDRWPDVFEIFMPYHHWNYTLDSGVGYTLYDRDVERR